MATSRELYVKGRRMTGPLTNWNYLNRTDGVFHSTYDESFEGRYTPPAVPHNRTRVTMRFPQGSFSSSDYPTQAGQSARPMLYNTWNARETAMDNKSNFEQTLIAPTDTFVLANATTNTTITKEQATIPSRRPQTVHTPSLSQPSQPSQPSHVHYTTRSVTVKPSHVVDDSSIPTYYNF